MKIKLHPYYGLLGLLGLLGFSNPVYFVFFVFFLFFLEPIFRKSKNKTSAKKKK